MILDLTPDEVEIINEKRKKEAREIERKNRSILLLELAVRYKKYLTDSGMGKTYSDFCSAMGADYGELDSIGYNNALIYSIVCEIIDYSDKCS